jgi:membrane-associated phospholipid phosphatase
LNSRQLLAEAQVFDKIHYITLVAIGTIFAFLVVAGNRPHLN